MSSSTHLLPKIAVQFKPVRPLFLPQWRWSWLLAPQSAHRPAWGVQQSADRTAISQVEQVGEDVVTQEVHALVNDRVDAQRRSTLPLQFFLPELPRISTEEMDDDLLGFPDPPSLMPIPGKPFARPPFLRQQPLQDVVWRFRKEVLQLRIDASPSRGPLPSRCPHQPDGPTGLSPGPYSAPRRS